LNWRKYPGHVGGHLREGLAKWLRVGKGQRLRAETRAEALIAAYRHKLVADLRNLKTLDVAKPLDLEIAYVPLQVLEEPHPHIGKSEGVERKARAMPPEEALIRFHRLAVLGTPGTGKTTMLRYLTLLAAQGRLENLPDFPILVSLGHFAAVPQVNLLDFVVSEIEARYGFPGLRLYLQERLEKGSVLLLLDGLDEANVGRPPHPWTGGLKGTEATYRHVVGQINILAARYPNCPMVVTARRGSRKGFLAASFHTLEVPGFNRDDIQRFLVNWFGASCDGLRELSRTAQDLKSALSQNPQMYALAANPLHLSLMAFTFERDGEPPKGRAGLYGRGVELLLEHRDLERAYLLTTEQKRSLLEEVALHFHLRRVLLFPEDELREVIASYLPAMDIPVDQIPTILEEISSQHGLLREQVSGWLSFPHPIWQEYFAAVAISKEGQLEWVLEGLHDPWWEGAVLFLAGVLEDAAPLLEGILAQEEDIFHSNLMLAGRCLAGISRIEGVGPSTDSGQRLWEDIIEGLKRLVEEGYHRLLQRQAIGVLAKIGGGTVVSFFIALLRREEIDLGVRAEVAEIVGSLHDKSAVPDLLAFLTDQKLDPSVRGNIAEALGSLGDESVIPPLLALLPDETVNPSVRGRVVEALSSLGDESVISPFLTSLPDEGIDPYVRERIIEALASLGAALMVQPTHHDPSTGLRASGFSKGAESLVSQLLSLLPDEKIHSSVRRRVAEAVGSLGNESVVPDLLALLSDEKIDPSVRAKAAEALGALGAESAIPPLLAALDDEKVDYSVRMTVAEVLGALGDELVASQLLALLPDEKIDPAVRASIAGALGILGEKSVVPQLLSLLPDERIDPSVRWKIVDALSSLGEKTIIPHLRALLPNEKIDPSVRWVVAEVLEALAEEPTENGEGRKKEEGRMEEALGWLDDRSRVPQLLALLTDERIDPSVSGRIINALGSLGDDRATVEGLAALLDRADIGSDVYEALFHVSQRAGMRVFTRKGGGYEVRPLDYALRPFDGTQGRLCLGQAQDKPTGVEGLHP
jgi:HEAT repeat protein